MKYLNIMLLLILPASAIADSVKLVSCEKNSVGMKVEVFATDRSAQMVLSYRGRADTSIYDEVYQKEFPKEGINLTESDAIVIPMIEDNNKMNLLIQKTEGYVYGVLQAWDFSFDIRRYFKPEMNESFYQLKCQWKYGDKWQYNY